MTYTTGLNQMSIFTISSIYSPDGVSGSVRIINASSVVSITPELKLKVLATNVLTDIKEHNVTLEVFIPNFPSETALYYVKVIITNALPLFSGPLTNYHMGLN